jgi:hypothetical protein
LQFVWPNWIDVDLIDFYFFNIIDLFVIWFNCNRTNQINWTMIILPIQSLVRFLKHCFLIDTLKGPQPISGQIWTWKLISQYLVLGLKLYIMCSRDHSPIRSGHSHYWGIGITQKPTNLNHLELIKWLIKFFSWLSH